MSETGVLDVFFFPGPNPTSIYKQFGHLTGFGVLPVEFSIAYHQCRWNYESANEVLRVNHNFDIFEMPYDAIWLDIEYTDDHKYFTWHPKEFRDPAAMQSVLDEAKRKLVVIIDPHIKVDKNYNISQQLSEKGLAVKDKSGNAYEGKCWPGLSNWIDGFNPATRSWWGSLFNINTFPYATENMHLWNDMNEPSVFDGPEASMPRDNLHHGNWEHRDVHNLYGMTVHSATYEGMVVRLGEGKKRRAFVLTRSYFAGSQRTAAVWTGDNQAEWSHLQQAFPMILSHGIAGMSFIGADVGGFAQTPSDELFTRWFQAGAFYPFFRSHSIKDVKRREPWMKGDTDIIRKALRLRYSLLPAWYTAFQRTSVEGIPVLRPNFVMFPNDEAGYAIDDQFYLGDSGLLVKPVVHEGAESVQIYLADDEPYYDYGAEHTLHQGKGMVTIAAPLWKIPMLHRGGHIYARKDRIRRSSTLMKYDPYTLVVAVSSKVRISLSECLLPNLRSY
jgi:alpha 1,3-glucosidase